MHWADVLAQRLLEQGDEHVLATAITPSGPIHVGNMREVLTSEMVHRALLGAGAESRFIYIADSYDPLRKVYPFLDEETYAPYVGHPVAEIPAPDPYTMVDGRMRAGDGTTSYADFFLRPFLSALADMGIEPELLDARAMYYEGRYRDVIDRALVEAGPLREIIEKVSKRQLEKDWLPFNVQCAACGSLRTVPLLHAHPMVQYRCSSCGVEAERNVLDPGAGKLPWRVDWPARWSFLGVTFEAAGKDHHAAGGSWDTGKAISKKVYGREPPMGTVYEFIQLKGKGAMHSSTGTAVSAEQMLRMTPPEVLRFLIARTEPRKHIDFDPGLGILNLVEDYDRFERIRYGAEEASAGIKDADRVYELSQPGAAHPRLPVQVPYRHLVTVVQMTDDDQGVVDILQRSEEIPAQLDDADRAHLVDRAHHVRAWLELSAPEDVRFEIQKEPPTLDVDATGEQVFAGLVECLGSLPADAWTGPRIHDAVYEVVTKLGLKPGPGFRWLYQAILGKDRGPRAGFFLASLDRDFVVARFRHYAP